MTDNITNQLEQLKAIRQDIAADSTRYTAYELGQLAGAALMIVQACNLIIQRRE